MELIFKEQFVKVYASKVGEWFCVWSSEYPSKYSLLGTCETYAEARELAETYAECQSSGVAF
jgi:hypothetical protein